MDKKYHARENCDVADFCVDCLIEDLRYVATLAATDDIDAQLMRRAADALGNAKKQVASDQHIIEQLKKNSEALYNRVKELEGERT